jgi:ferritin-like metal-binding protein YciE
MAISDTIQGMFGGGEMKNLHDLFVNELKDIYYAEQQITEALPKMAEKSTSAKLRQAFEKHLEQTEGHVERLEKIFDLLGLEPETETCEVMDGLVKETEEIMSSAEDEVLDAGLVASAQAVEHYEMARYGTLLAWASEMGHAEVAHLLQQTLKEEEATDNLLSTLAEKTINPAAMANLPPQHAKGSRSGISASGR